MTDLERFVELYRSFGIECVVTEGENPGEGRIVLESGPPPKLVGYPSAFSEVTFSADGTFLRQGFWE